MRTQFLALIWGELFSLISKRWAPHLMLMILLSGSPGQAGWAVPPMVVTHPSTHWDHTSSIDKPVNLLAEWILQNRKNVVLLTHEIHNPSYFLKNYSHYLESPGGSHDLKLVDPRVVVAGGKFSMCLAETLRDLIVGSSDRHQKLHILLPMEAIYQPPLGLDLTRELDSSRTLRELTESLSDSEFRDYIVRILFTEKGLGRQNPFGRPEASLKKFAFQLIRHGRPVGHHGSGNFAVTLEFLTVPELKQKSSPNAGVFHPAGDRHFSVREKFH